MRYSADWMVLLDDRILEYLNENEAAQPHEIEDGTNLEYSRQHIARRCRKLNDEGLIRVISASTYVITDEGEAYLAEAFDVENWRYLDNRNQAEASGNGASIEEASNGN